MNKNKDIFDKVIDKIYSILNRELEKPIKSNFSFDTINDININIVKQLKEKYGIGGIILDVDDTLRKDMVGIPECNKKWIEFIKREFKIFIVSNGYDGEIKKYTNEEGINYISFAGKPFKKNFILACKEMGLEPENVLVVGNDIINDIHGGNRSGMITALIRHVDDTCKVKNYY